MSTAQSNFASSSDKLACLSQLKTLRDILVMSNISGLNYERTIKSEPSMLTHMIKHLGRVHNTLISSQLKNGHIKLACFDTVQWKASPGRNTSLLG